MFPISRYISTLTAIALFTSGCHTFSAKHTDTDPILVDSLTLWAEHTGADKATVTAYVMDSTVTVYRLDGDHLYPDTTLHLTDSVTVTRDQAELHFTGRFYPVVVHDRHGYIRGTSLGAGLHSDFDNDGRQDLIIYGYSSWVRDSLMDNPQNHITVKFISATGHVSEIHDSTSSDLELTEVADVRLSKKVHVYELNAGYPACGYPQYHLIIAYGHDKAETIHRVVTSVDSGLGDYCQFYYPSDSKHHTDTIYISHRQGLPLSEQSDSIVTSTSDSTILYLHEGSWGAKNYKLDSNSN